MRQDLAVKCYSQSIIKVMPTQVWTGSGRSKSELVKRKNQSNVLGGCSKNFPCEFSKWPKNHNMCLPGWSFENGSQAFTRNNPRNLHQSFIHVIMVFLVILPTNSSIESKFWLRPLYNPELTFANSILSSNVTKSLKMIHFFSWINNVRMTAMTHWNFNSLGID